METKFKLLTSQSLINRLLCIIIRKAGFTLMKRAVFSYTLLFLMLSAMLCPFARAQKPDDKQNVRTVTIPISIFTKKELKERQAEEYVQADRLTVKEAGDEQQILSIRSIGESPLSIAILIQDDLAPEFNLQLEDIRKFIRGLPRGTRVMVGYIRGGSTQIRQKFTDDLDRASKSLRIVSSSPTSAPRDPYDSVNDMLGRFDALPSGRHAVLLFSDGLDTTEGLSLASAARTADLERATLKSQRKGIPVYSIYFPATNTSNGRNDLILAAQSALSKLSEDTGGRVFIRGTSAPINLEPFFNDLVLALNRQFALTYLSTHMKKGYYKIKVLSTNPEVKIEHPAGYYYH